MIENTDLLIIGGGPAGLAASVNATREGLSVTLVDDALTLGGQLIKQTHKFFGSEMEYAGVRGIDIPAIFLKELKNNPLFQAHTRTAALGIYEDGVVTALKEEKEVLKYKPKAILVATGAREKMIPFPGNDLPGVYGAGAMQTLMNVYGVKPGDSILMIGAGNIGLIVSYQLYQAGVKVAAVVEGLPNVGGYWVHASKIRRLGIPILTRHTIVEAHGENEVTGATIAQIDENWKVIPGTENKMDVDTICLAVGLSPLSDFFYQAGCEMKFVRELSGDVPTRNEFMETTTPGVFVAGDAGGIEEASSAMIEGYIAGLSASKHVLGNVDDFENRIKMYKDELDNLRKGHVGDHIKAGLQKVTI